jgi:hypothetical protein
VNLKERAHLKNINVGRRMILKWASKEMSVDLIRLALGKDKYWAIVNAVMNLRIP